ncbi:NIPSNAP family protein [Dokdonella sp.]|uniref:NIPSNAP family protein n=1 Tax=Dokdonella sp. TaxID=2291710 RepID=UPI002612EAB2|nr:NIPSNAP family protein [Dokdonella sp.]
MSAPHRQRPADGAAPLGRDGSHDFDFWFGRWHVANERLVRRLAGSDEWERFEATQECRPILGGIGNIDDFVTEWGGGFVGMTLRLYDVGRREWSLYWAGNRTGVLEPPVVGRFENGVGTFYGRDVHEGRPVRVRFLWSQISRDGALWQQAFLPDDGRPDDGEAWETNWIMHMTRLDASGRHGAGAEAIAPTAADCAVVELRQYTLHPGRRDELIDLFEREFVEPQEACGMRLLGQFRDLDDPERFVWLRGFRSMDDRAAALTAFYGGATWALHRAAANATMIDSDDVLLLRPARDGSGFALAGGDRPAAGAPATPAGLVVAMLWTLPESGAGALEQRVAAWLRTIGARPLACFVSEHAKNTFPALPVREGENVCACFAGFDDEAHWQRHAGELPRTTGGAPHVLRLAPTRRSLLRGRTPAIPGETP